MHSQLAPLDAILVKVITKILEKLVYFVCVLRISNHPKGKQAFLLLGDRDINAAAAAVLRLPINP